MSLSSTLLGITISLALFRKGLCNSVSDLYHSLKILSFHLVRSGKILNLLAQNNVPMAEGGGNEYKKVKISLKKGLTNVIFYYCPTV